MGATGGGEMMDLEQEARELRDKFGGESILSEHGSTRRPWWKPGSLDRGTERGETRKRPHTPPHPNGQQRSLHGVPVTAAILLRLLPGAKIGTPPPGASWRIEGDGWYATHYYRRSRLLVQGANLQVAVDAVKGAKLPRLLVVDGSKRNPVCAWCDRIIQHGETYDSVPAPEYPRAYCRCDDSCLSHLMRSLRRGGKP